ncbi:MAG: hypothetical protein L0Y44_10475 [Phycisphaerales bacterium]|nr:hypothetical protein [Phycisphaerales bacterium]
MHVSNRKPLFFGLIAGVALTLTSALLMGQGASIPAKSETQYFVTAEGDAAHLWVREGTKLRCVGHGECATYGHDHDHDHDHDDHNHGKEKSNP